MAPFIPGPGAQRLAGLGLGVSQQGGEWRMGSVSEGSGKAPKINSADFRAPLKPAATIQAASVRGNKG